MEKTKVNQNKEPLIHISRRDNISTRKLIAIKAIAIITALIISCIIVAIVYGTNPFIFIGSLFEGIFGTTDRLWVFLKDMAILLGIGLALLPAFKMKYWNTGADGQVLVSALSAYVCLFYLGGKVNDILLVFICLFAAIISGIIWATIPAIFKAIWNTNETLFTLMMNYVATQLVAVFVNSIAKNGSGIAPVIDNGSLGMIYQYLTPVLIVILLLITVSIYIKHTKHGFELSLVGESVNSAKYVGINVKLVIVRTLVVSGIICGIIGFLLTNGLNHVINANVTGGRGFTAIIVVWLADFKPYFMVLSAFLITFINNGTSLFLTNEGITDTSIVLIISSIIIFFIIGCTFFSKYKFVYRRNEEGKIDNGFVRWLAKVFGAIQYGLNVVVDYIVAFFAFIIRKIKGLFIKNKEKEAEEEITEASKDDKENDNKEVQE